MVCTLLSPDLETSLQSFSVGKSLKTRIGRVTTKPFNNHIIIHIIIYFIKRIGMWKLLVLPIYSFCLASVSSESLLVLILKPCQYHFSVTGMIFCHNIRKMSCSTLSHAIAYILTLLKKSTTDPPIISSIISQHNFLHRFLALFWRIPWTIC